CGLGAYWWVQLRTIVRHSLGRISGDFIAESNHRTIILEARLHLVLYLAVIGASILFETTIFLFYWLIPAILGTVSLRLFLHAEHAGCELSDNMLRNTRTTLTNPAIKLLSWNMPFHCEHHAFPAVPFHQLPALHQHLKSHLAVVSNGYYRFHREFVDSV
ncbi:MAG: fatty acid desaturase, partial [Gammaproteobacteria bacterium]|nr:fatty acid desaturase [Gammaproteobacteria bacterium]